MAGRGAASAAADAQDRQALPKRLIEQDHPGIVAREGLT